MSPIGFKYHLLTPTRPCPGPPRAPCPPLQVSGFFWGRNFEASTGVGQEPNHSTSLVSPPRASPSQGTAGSSAVSGPAGDFLPHHSNSESIVTVPARTRRDWNPVHCWWGCKMGWLLRRMAEWLLKELHTELPPAPQFRSRVRPKGTAAGVQTKRVHGYLRWHYLQWPKDDSTPNVHRWMNKYT